MTATMAHPARLSGLVGTAADLSDALPRPARPHPDVPSATSSGADQSADAPTDEPVGLRVRRASELLGAVVAGLDPGRLTGADAARLYGLLAGVERLAMAGKTLLAPRIDESGVWRDSGHRNTAVMLADLEGVPTGQARNTLEVGHRLHQLPSTEQVLRSGTLSGPKLSELSGAAVLDPTSEVDLLRGAAEEGLQRLKERCQRSRATSSRNDPVEAVRRIHTARKFSSWTDAEGAFCFQGRDTADRGARILQQLEFTASRLRRTDVRSTGGDDPTVPRTTDANRRADAFFLLMTGGGVTGGLVEQTFGTVDDDDPGPPDEQIIQGFTPGHPPGPAGQATVGGGTGSDGASQVIERPPNCSVMVRVDLDALLRGHTLPGEICELDNHGPIPVAMARDMADDSFLRMVFHQAGDIRSVSHFGRTINRTLRTALAHRDRCCVVPGCGVAYGLEIDHIRPFAEGGPTSLDNLALLCHHHHYLKTYEGWTLERSGSTGEGTPAWAFTPIPPFGQEPDPDLDRKREQREQREPPP
jgi:hypothetical protein